MAGAGAARSSGPVGIKALAEATQVASTASGYATEYILRKFCKVFDCRGSASPLYVRHGLVDVWRVKGTNKFVA